MRREKDGKRKRGPRPKRTPETTKQLLVHAVGDILKEEGWQGLGVNKIAYRAGVDKKMIYWHFESYNNLLKTYLKSHDFWQPVFQEFDQAESLDDANLPAYITSIFQHQFRSFYSDQIMQTFIHWQITDPGALLKEISEEREVNGAKIAALTDPHFSDTTYNFRAILALLLGGVYYVVWHARNNGTTVCGIDINRDQDREDLVRSLGQVIDLVWAAAENEMLNKPPANQ